MSTTATTMIQMSIDQILLDLESGADLGTIATGVEAILLDLDALAKQVRPESVDLLRSVRIGLDGVKAILGTREGNALDALLDPKIRAAIRTPLELARLSLGWMRPASLG